MADEGKLFIGGLCFDTTEDCLKESFSKYGHVLKADVVRDRESNKSRGFGFVTFQNPQDAKDAKAAMDGKCVDGKQIRVDEAGKPSGRSGGAYRGQGSRGSGFYRGSRRGDCVGYGQRYGERPYGDKGYGDGYRREGFSGGRSYGDEDRSYAGYRSGTSRGGGGGSGGGSGYNPAYSRDNRSQGSYGGEQRSTSYRDDYDSYDSYASKE